MIKYDNLFSFLVAATCLSASVYGFLQINELKVPAAVRNGDVDELILDCDYSAQNVSGIEVKWFYNGDKDQIYQWIPGGTAGGFAMGSLKDYIDASFQVTNDKSTMYRALKLKNVTLKMTGSYTCKVSGFTEEAVATKNLTIYVPPSDGVNLTVIPEALTAICSVSGVFPEPIITLVIRRGNDTENTADIKINESLEKIHSLFSKITTMTFENNSITSTSEFICVMRIPGTEYEITETRLFSQGNLSIRPYLQMGLLQLTLLMIFL